MKNSQVRAQVIGEKFQVPETMWAVVKDTTVVALFWSDVAANHWRCNSGLHLFLGITESSTRVFPVKFVSEEEDR